MRVKQPKVYYAKLLGDRENYVIKLNEANSTLPFALNHKLITFFNRRTSLRLDYRPVCELLKKKKEKKNEEEEEEKRKRIYIDVAPTS